MKSFIVKQTYCLQENAAKQTPTKISDFISKIASKVFDIIKIRQNKTK
jgi:hypothetical protein